MPCCRQAGDREVSGRPTGSRVRAGVTGLMLALGSVGLMLLLGELSFRIYEGWRQTKQPWTAPHPELGYILKQDLPWVNSLGIRERPAMPKRRPRILVVGDSVAWAGDDRSFPRLLEQLINVDGRPGHLGVEVFNAGIPGYTTYQEVTWYELFGHRLKPDLVLLQFCLNDVPRILHTFDEYGRLPIAPEVWADFEGAFMGRWIRRSRFLTFVVERSYRLKRAVSVRRATSYSFNARIDFYRAWEDDGWIEIQNLIRRLRDRVTQDQGKLAILVFPFGHQLRSDYLERDEGYVLKPQRKMQEIADRLQIPVLNLFEVFRGHREYLYDDIHLSDEALPLIAGEVYRFLHRESLLSFGSNPDSGTAGGELKSPGRPSTLDGGVRRRATPAAQFKVYSGMAGGIDGHSRHFSVLPR